MKTCTKCREIKELSEFGNQATSKDGLMSYCRKCKSISAKKYSLANKDKISAKDKIYYKKNKKHILARVNKYRNENNSAIIKKKKDYYRKNKEVYASKSKIYRDNNSEYLLTAKKEYYKINKEEFTIKLKAYKKTTNGRIMKAASNAKRRAKELKGFIENTKDENYLIECIYAFCQFKSKITGILHHVDHIYPYAKGGKHHPSNLQILTATENLKKGARIA